MAVAAACVVAVLATSYVLFLRERAEDGPVGGSAATAGSRPATLPPARRVRVPGLRQDPTGPPSLAWDPVLFDDLVAVVAGQELVAFDRVGLEEWWRLPCPDRHEPFASSSHSDRFLGVECGRRTTMVDPGSGTVVAELPPSRDQAFGDGATVSMTPFGLRIAGSTVPGPADRAAPSVVPGTGLDAPRWTRAIPGDRLLGLDASRFYWVGPGDEVVAYHLADGTEAWRSGIRSRRVAIGDGAVAVLADRDELAVLDAATGRRLSGFRTDDLLSAAEPVGLAGDLVILREQTLGLYGLDRVTGAVRWAVPLEASRQGELHAGRVVVEDKGGLLVVDATDGFVLLRVPHPSSLAAVGGGVMAYTEGTDELVVQPLSG